MPAAPPISRRLAPRLALTGLALLTFLVLAPFFAPLALAMWREWTEHQDEVEPLGEGP